MKKLLSGLLCLLLLVGCSSSESSKSVSIADIQNRGTLIVGTSPDYPPFEFYDSVSGEIVGYDIFIAQAIADELGVELEIKSMSFDMLVQSVRNGNVDMVLSGMSPTDKRKEVISFSNQYFSNEAVLLVNKSDVEKLSTTEGLAKAKIGAQMGSIQGEAIDTALSDGKISEVIKLSTIPELVQNLKVNAVDAVLLSRNVAKQHVNMNPELEIIEVNLDLETEGMAVAFAKDSTELVKFVNDLIVKWENDGSFDKWMDQANQLASKTGDN